VAGLAGSTAAAMLGRAGTPAVLIDPHQTYPFDFRVEKLSGGVRLDRFCRTGIADSALRSTTLTEKTGSRASAICSTRSRASSSASCTTLIMAIRAEVPKPAELI
jgi:2-polyprenyl-6-methoxyphenol hydroxylase-like FAD-dependent oxidoreductase